jgi:hypothetical protein
MDAFRECRSLSSAVLNSTLTKLGEGTVRVFRQELAHSRMPLVPTPARLKLLHVCDRHSSRVPHQLTLHKLRPTIQGCFAGCKNLCSVRLPSGLEVLDRVVFQNCSSLTDVVIPTRLTTLGDECFAGCNQLTEAVLPDSIHVALGSCALFRLEITHSRNAIDSHSSRVKLLHACDQWHSFGYSLLVPVGTS